MLRFIQFGQNYVSIQDFGEVNAQAKQKCENLEQLIKKCQLVTKDYFNYVDEYFCKLRNEIDLKKEEFILIIEENHQRVLKNLQEQENNCMAQAEIKTSEFNRILEASHEKLIEWYQHLRIPNFRRTYNKHWEKINLKAEQESIKLNTLLANYHNDLFLFKECKFKPKEIIDHNNFGDLEVISKESDPNYNLEDKVIFKINKFKSFLQNYEWRESSKYCLVNNIAWRLQAHIEMTENYEMGLFIYVYADCDYKIIKENPTRISISVLVIQNSEQTLKPKTYDMKKTTKRLKIEHPICLVKEIMNPKMDIYDKLTDSITIETTLKHVKY